jgi:tRNA nucleotidyltransferase (CCA-adding enzyme)
MTADPNRLRPPTTVVDIARTLSDAGFETWCVGGAVRDALLGLSNLDWDIATAATPDQVKRLFRRTVPVGIAFGTIGVLDRHGIMHEVTTFRRDVSTDGRHAVVEFGASLDEDLARRDFTVNAIAFDPIHRLLHDPFEGQKDLAARIIRAVGEPEERMREDRLRALRAIRFAARFGFEFDPVTWRAVTDSAPFLGRLSPERVKQEIEKTMEQVAHPSRAFTRWRDAGAFEAVVPALSTISDRSLAALDCLAQPGLRGRPGRRALRMAALFGDVDGARAEQALKALRFSNQDIAWIAALVQRWAKLGPALTRDLFASPAGPSDGALRRLASGVGRERVAAFMRLAAAHWAVLPEGERPPATAVRALHRRLIRVAFHDAIEAGDLAIDGDDLRAAGIPAGPALGRVLTMLLDEVIETPSLNQRESLLARAQSLFAATSPGRS